MSKLIHTNDEIISAILKIQYISEITQREYWNRFEEEQEFEEDQEEPPQL